MVEAGGGYIETSLWLFYFKRWNSLEASISPEVSLKWTTDKLQPAGFKCKPGLKDSPRSYYSQNPGPYKTCAV